MGSNVDRDVMLGRAMRAMRQHPGMVVLATSAVYETAPVGGVEGAPDFYNAAVRVSTDLDPTELREELRLIESRLGRVRTGDKYAPRRIDLDLSLYGNLAEVFEGWELPDPELVKYPHVLVPLAEVAPGWIHPTEGVTLAELTDKVVAEDTELVRRAPDTLRRIVPSDGRFSVDFEADPGEVYDPEMESLVRDILINVGEDPEREGLLRTPLRVAKALDFLTSGYNEDLHAVINNAIFDSEGATEMVVVKDIEFYSMCEHHMLPFFGKAAVAYLPKGKIIGLSKVARLVDHFARRLQVQERMTNQVADSIVEVMAPHGAAVVLAGHHLCMMMRGVQKQSSAMITSAMRGTFRSDARTRSEFLDLIRD